MVVRVYDDGNTLHRTPITPSNSRTHAKEKTYQLFVQGQHDTRSIRSTNEDQHKAVIAVIIVYVDSEMAYEHEIMPLIYCIER